MYMLRAVLRWLVRRRVDADLGMWWLPGLDSLLGISAVVVTRDILIGFITYLGIKAIAMVLGYVDVHYFKRIQYQNEYTTRLNEYLVGIINGRAGRTGRKIQDKAG